MKSSKVNDFNEFVNGFNALLTQSRGFSDDKLKEIKSMKIQQLRNKAKEMGFQRFTRLDKKELLELIQYPLAPPTSKIKKRVTIIERCYTCLTNHVFSFPSISLAAKYFDVNPGIFGEQFYRTSDYKLGNSIVINGKMCKIVFGSLKKYNSLVDDGLILTEKLSLSNCLFPIEKCGAEIGAKKKIKI